MAFYGYSYYDAFKEPDLIVKSSHGIREDKGTKEWKQHRWQHRGGHPLARTDEDAKKMRNRIRTISNVQKTLNETRNDLDTTINKMDDINNRINDLEISFNKLQTLGSRPVPNLPGPNRPGPNRPGPNRPVETRPNPPQFKNSTKSRVERKLQPRLR